MMTLPLPDGVWYATFNKKRIEELWDFFKGYDNLFADDNMRDPEIFFKQLIDYRTICLEYEGGLLLLQRLIPALRAEVHFLSWDHKMSAYSDLFKECLLWAFLSFDLERIETFVAKYAKSVQRFVEERLGFKYEGTFRKRVRHQGELIDMKIYSKLREEALE